MATLRKQKIKVGELVLLDQPLENSPLQLLLAEIDKLILGKNLVLPVPPLQPTFRDSRLSVVTRKYRQDRVRQERRATCTQRKILTTHCHAHT